MAEYLEREKVLNKLHIAYDLARLDQKAAISSVMSDINALPSADVQPVKRGKWIEGDKSFIFCSECHKEAYWDTDYGQQLFDYCPYCGAKMSTE